MTLTLLFFFLLFALAAYRTTILLTDENGPYDILKKLRESQGIYHGHIIDMDTGMEVPAMHLSEDATILGKLLYCQHCTSGWITLFYAGLFGGLFLIGLQTLTLATLTIFIWFGMWGAVRIFIKNIEE